VSERESGFTSKQRKKVIYGQEKHRNRKNKEQNNRKVEKNRKVKRKKTVLLLCLTSILQSVWPHTVCCHLFVVVGLRTSMIRIAMLAGVFIPKPDRLKAFLVLFLLRLCH